MVRNWMVTLTALVGLVGCAEDEQTLSSGSSPAYESEMFHSVLTELTTKALLPSGGDWPEDFGDSNFYGPAFFIRYGTTNNNTLQLDLARQTDVFNSKLVEKAMRNIGILLNQLEDVMMAVFGLMEVYHVEPDPARLKQLDDAIDVLNMLGKALGYYPENSTTVGGYGVDTYGPTTTNATLALLNVEYAILVGGAKKATRLAEAEAILTAGRTVAFDDKLGHYQFSSTKGGLYLYPNITQMVAHLRVYQLTQKKVYLDRARAIHTSIQPLKVKGEGRYRSPYSAKFMGAKTSDYTTLSSQNFVLFGLSLLYKYTQDSNVKQEILDILSFIESHLLKNGRILHHWMDGHLAHPNDPEYYCTGCNLQLLYILHRLDELLAAPK